MRAGARAAVQLRLASFSFFVTLAWVGDGVAQTLSSSPRRGVVTKLWWWLRGGPWKKSVRKLIAKTLGSQDGRAVTPPALMVLRGAVVVSGQFSHPRYLE